MSTFDFVTSVMEQATRKINEQHERIEELQFENAKLREELQQSEDRFRNIPDEVWSKTDLVEMTNKALEERDDADKQNAALREDSELLSWLLKRGVCWRDCDKELAGEFWTVGHDTEWLYDQVRGRERIRTAINAARAKGAQP